MNIKDITDFVNNNKKLLGDLRGETSDSIADVKMLELIKTNCEQANKFVNALNEKISIENSEDRLKALNAAITGLESELAATDNDLQQMALNNRIAVLEQMRANVQVACSLNAIVAFTDDERKEIEGLLKKAEDDIDNRNKMNIAIDIIVRLIAIGARIAGTAATSGVV